MLDPWKNFTDFIQSEGEAGRHLEVNLWYAWVYGATQGRLSLKNKGDTKQFVEVFVSSEQGLGPSIDELMKRWRAGDFDKAQDVP